MLFKEYFKVLIVQIREEINFFFVLTRKILAANLNDKHLKILLKKHRSIWNFLKRS